MNTGRSRLTAVLTLLVSLLVLFASLEGLTNKNLYQEVVSAGTLTKSLMAGSLSQDIVSIPLSLILALLSFLMIKQPGFRKLIAILGITGNFFYGYGLYVMQGQYTSIYLIYLAIFGLSIYSIILGFISFEPNALNKWQLPGAMRWSIIIFLIVILSILVPGWLLRISPAIANHKPEGAYAVFILDLCVVFPAFAITVIQLLHRKPFGILLSGISLFKIFTVCLSWAFSQWFVTLYGFKADYSMIIISSSLTVISLVLMVLYLLKLNANFDYKHDNTCSGLVINHDRG